MAGTLHAEGAGLKDKGVVGDFEGGVGVLFDQENGDAFLVQRLNDFKDIPDDEGGQTEGRLIHHQELGTHHEGTSYRQHLLLAAGKGSCQLPGTFLEAGEKLINVFHVSGDVIFPQVGTNAQVLIDGEVGEDTASFRNHAQAF